VQVHELIAIKRDILLVLNGLDEPYGRAVQRELERTQGREILAARVYSNLNDLVEIGLVEKGRKNRRKNEYTLTPAGHEEVEHRIRWERQYVQS
jgi:DNA-binding PadR family transcriptional regulator